MQSLQCVGRPSEVSSKVSEKEVAPLKPAFGSSADPEANESVEWKPNSGGCNASKAPSFRNVTTHGHKLPKQVPPIMTALEKREECDVQTESVREVHTRAPQVELSASDRDPLEAQSEEDENESAEGHVPLELFAEFLQAVMTKNYQLAKKLCQMILIYEPQNSEAKSFLPLIEEKLLIEADEESDDDDDDESDESDTSDDDDDVENDDDESSDDESSDTDEGSTDSTDDTLSSSS
ncbi:glutamate-rich protein 2 isoform X7 [Puntigrus tetrazona]|uniref:glutamate-rich protein 2 isoform X7 n=1 Tax=Puntigrus tetrazona TaxID=1606681 RepID=UPI001C8ACBE4|nr:glutamate-rich protein 2 isoform X7 [Puntigrus tetrazona]